MTTIDAVRTAALLLGPDLPEGIIGDIALRGKTREVEMSLIGFTANTLFDQTRLAGLADPDGLNNTSSQFQVTSRQTGNTYRLAILAAVPVANAVVAGIQLWHQAPVTEWRKVLLRPAVVGEHTLIAVVPGWPL